MTDPDFWPTIRAACGHNCNPDDLLAGLCPGCLNEYDELLDRERAAWPEVLFNEAYGQGAA